MFRLPRLTFSYSYFCFGPCIRSFSLHSHCAHSDYCSCSTILLLFFAVNSVNQQPVPLFFSVSNPTATLLASPPRATLRAKMMGDDEVIYKMATTPPLIVGGWDDNVWCVDLFVMLVSRLGDVMGTRPLLMLARTHLCMYVRRYGQQQQLARSTCAERRNGRSGNDREAYIHTCFHVYLFVRTYVCI